MDLVNNVDSDVSSDICCRIADDADTPSDDI